MGIEASILRQPPPCSVNYLFASWFNRGFLELRRIDWQSKRQQGSTIEFHKLKCTK
jgi:hypothetical protein